MNMVQIVVLNFQTDVQSFYVEPHSCLDAARLLSSMPGAYSMGVYFPGESLDDAWRVRKRFDSKEWTEHNGC